jgi:hypothetical protein
MSNVISPPATETPAQPHPAALAAVRQQHQAARQRQCEARAQLLAALGALEEATRDVLRAQASDPTKTDDEAREQLVMALEGNRARWSGGPAGIENISEAITQDAALALLGNAYGSFSAARRTALACFAAPAPAPAPAPAAPPAAAPTQAQEAPPIRVEYDEDRGGGPYVRVYLPNGKVALVWAQSIDEPDKSVVELMPSVQALEDGDYGDNCHLW